METKNGIQVFYAKSGKEWRKWLAKNSQTETAVWLTIYHKNSNTSSVYYDESVEEALCFGWIDNKALKRDEDSYYLLFRPRTAKSNWSKVNRVRAEKMISKGLMMPGGQALIDLAKETGTWEQLETAQNNIIPADLQQLFNKNKKAFNNFQAFAPSSKRLILEWILKAKRPATRQQRIAQTVSLAADNIKANHR